MSTVNCVSSPEIDHICYQDETIYEWNSEKTEIFQLSLLKEAVLNQYSSNTFYKKYCDNVRFKPSQIRLTADLANVPMLPTATFKQQDVITNNENEIAKVCLSSGTKGYVSKIMRCEITLDRLLNSISTGLKEFYGLEPDQAIIANLGPDTNEAGDVWFSYIMSVTDIFFDTQHFVQESKFLVEELIAYVADTPADKRLILIGSPPMFKALTDYILAKGKTISIPDSAMMITAGGWKKNEHEKMDRADFENTMESILGIERKNIFDSYNQVELNTVLFECAYKKKHVPAWLKVIVKDPLSLKEVENGKLGILSYLDPTANSYPCFILSDDLGRVETDCKCGRKGKYIEHVRRVVKVETKGCAIKMNNILDASTIC